MTGIKVYKVSKKLSDAKMDAMSGGSISSKSIDRIIDHDADVYTDDGKLLARFRKQTLPDKNVKLFYDNVIGFAKNKTYNRGEMMGVDKGKRGYLSRNKEGIRTNIIGYMDGFSATQKIIMKRKGIASPMTIRESRFIIDYPDKWSKAQPLIRDIDKKYKSLIPAHYKKQMAKSRKMKFKIKGTSFTTVTTNVNVHTKIHKDKGDDEEGFGNLAVIENGEYSGGETCLPQYGVGFDVRSGDVLFMDVHEWHGNLPMKEITPGAIRLSIVCYLRTRIYDQEMKFDKTAKRKHMRFLKKMTKKKR
tara:strand:+ start:1464 stop:2372 length:909 start_codon:yes stop_codon:yes gene_type:complete